jgi:hypothetical protein
MHLLLRRPARQRQEHLVQSRPPQRDVLGLHAGHAERRKHGLQGRHRIARRAGDHPAVAIDRDRLAAAGPLDCRAGRRERILRAHDHVDLRPADPRLQRRRRPVRDHPPAVDHRDLIRELVGLLEVVRGQQHRRALGHEGAHDLPDLVAIAGILAGGRLVQEQHARREDEARREVEPSPHPAGVVLGLPARVIGEPEALEQLVRPPPRPPRAEVEQPPERLQVLAAGQGVVDSILLARQPDPEADRAGIAHHVQSRHPRAPGIRPQQSREDPHRGRLARAVGAEQPAHRALRHGEVKAVQGDRGAVALDQALRFDRQTGYTVRHSAYTVRNATMPVK